jgi:hypothetical protein
MRSSVQATLSRLAELQEEIREFSIMAAERLQGARLAPLFRFLSDVPHLRNVEIQNLVIVGELQYMNEYNITQSGIGHSAIVDSFKVITQEMREQVSPEAADALDQLVAAVTQSQLPDNAKTNALSALSEISKEVVKSGSLTDKVQLLWKGVRSVLDTIPKAIEIWTKLDGLWSWSGE